MMQEPYRSAYDQIIDAINKHEIDKEELLRQLDDDYACKRISTQEYFDALNKIDEKY